MAATGKLGLTQNDLYSTLRQINFKSNSERQTIRSAVQQSHESPAAPLSPVCPCPSSSILVYHCTSASYLSTAGLSMTLSDDTDAI